MKVYQAINAVQSDLSKEGISKDRKNQQQGYNFRGIDDVYNALSPFLAKNGLCILPRILTRECTERQTQKGGTLFYVVVEAEFDLVASEDGSKHTIRTFGEAMDSADKATNKAMSAAYKYACMQAFAIPTEGDNDADQSTHEVTPTARVDQRKPEAVKPKAATDAAAYIAEWQTYVSNSESEFEIRETWTREKPQHTALGLTEMQIAGMLAVAKKRFAEIRDASLLMAGQ